MSGSSGVWAEAARGAAGLALAALFSTATVAWSQQPAPRADEVPSPPRQQVQPAPGTQAGATGGIQSQNIFEVRPDADQDPKYMEQNNAQRNQVQPGNNAPMWRDAAGGIRGYSSLPFEQAPEAGVLIQSPVQYPGSLRTSAGEAWRQVRNIWIIPYGSALLLIVLAALAIMYFAKGPIGHSDAQGRPVVQRFTPFERAAHWANAIAFCILAISGIVMAFGKFFLLPIIGATLFGGLAYLLKNLHNFVGPLFVVSMVIVFLTFVKDNFPARGDLRWLLRLGGLLGPAPSHRFNAGEKLVFWGGVLLLGTIVIASGLVLNQLIPGLLYERQTMQVANMVHAVAAVLMMAMFMGHIYIGTIGMRGAYRAMRSGWVDEAWAREHHAYWWDDVRAGKVPVQRKPEPGAPADVRVA